MIDTTGMLGRVRELRKANSALIAGHNILIIGPNGMGKTAFLNYVRLLADAYKYLHLTLSDISIATSLKQAVNQYHDSYPKAFYIKQDLYDGLSNEAVSRHEKRVKRVGDNRDGCSYVWDMPWKDLSRVVGTASSIEKNVDILHYSLLASKEFCKAELPYQVFHQVLFMERLGILTPARSNMLDSFFGHCQVVAILRQEKAHLDHLKQLQNKFPIVIELKPLSGDETRALVSKWIHHKALSFDSDAAKAAFVQHVVRDSGGIPSNIEVMLNRAGSESQITKSLIREFSNKHVEYKSTLPLFMLFFFIIAAFKTMYRAMGDMSALVLGIIAGIIFFVLIVARSELEKDK